MHLHALLASLACLAFASPNRAAEPAASAAPATAPLPAAAPPAPAETMASRELRAVMAREAAIWERLRARPDDTELRKRADTDFRDVLVAYENVLRSSPNTAEAYAAYGLLLSRTGNREDATLAFLRANKLNPNLPMVKNQLGNLLFEEGNYEAALGYYLAAIELAPREPLYHYSLGSILHEFRKFYVADGIYTHAALDRQMLAAFRRAAELAPDNWGYTYRHAEAFYDLHTPDWPAALAAWEVLEARAGTPVEQQTIRLHRANILATQGRADEARALLAGITEPSLATNKASVEARLAEGAAAPQAVPPPETGRSPSP